MLLYTPCGRYREIWKFYPST